MKLSELGITIAKVAIRFKGQPSPTGVKNRDEQEYYEWELSEPISIRCSTMPEMEAVEVDKLWLSETTIEDGDWSKDDKGLFIEGYVADFSKNHLVGLYLDKPISKWARDKRKDDRATRNGDILKRIQDRYGK